MHLPAPCWPKLRFHGVLPSGLPLRPENNIQPPPRGDDPPTLTPLFTEMLAPKSNFLYINFQENPIRSTSTSILRASMSLSDPPL